MKFKIISDSTCDLSKDLVEKYDIAIVPLTVIKDGVSYKDGVNITPAEIFAHVAAGGDLCSTAAMNVGEYEECFEKGLPVKQLSKEFVREWLMANGFQGQEGQQVPEMTPEIVSSISERYIELYEKVTGMKFEKADDSDDILKRIEKNIAECLENLE